MSSFHSSNDDNDDDKNSVSDWPQWIWGQMPKQHTFAHTGFLGESLLVMAGYVATPMITSSLKRTASSAVQSAASYVLSQSISKITGSAWGSPQSTSLMNHMLAIPSRVFGSVSSSLPSSMQYLLATNPPAAPPQQLHAQAFQALQTATAAAMRGDDTAKYWALGLSSMATLYLEYLGANQMAQELPRIKSLVASNQGHPMTVVDQCKQLLSDRYSQAAYYTNPDTQSFFTLKETDPVRTVYNLLVGLNTGFFQLLQTQSLDPAAEVYHWGAIWFYWEVLAHLVHMYGLSPVQTAYKQLHAQLIQQHQQQPPPLQPQQQQPPPKISKKLELLRRRLANRLNNKK